MGCLLPFWGASDLYDSTSRVVFSSRSPAHVGFAANHFANTNLNLPLFMGWCLCIRVCLHQMPKWRVKTTRWDHFRTKIFAFFVQQGSPSPTFPFSSGIQMLFPFHFPARDGTDYVFHGREAKKYDGNYVRSSLPFFSGAYKCCLFFIFHRGMKKNIFSMDKRRKI